MTDSAPSLSRLRWRCRRGMRELDQLLGAWLDQAWPSATQSEQAAFDRLLDCEDDQIWDWLMGRAQPPCAELHALIKRIGDHHQTRRQQAQHKTPQA